MASIPRASRRCSIIAAVCRSALPCSVQCSSKRVVDNAFPYWSSPGSSDVRSVKTLEFYVEFLGFKVDWDHRFSPDLPLYLQVSMGCIVLHLSEHHGDSSPGAKV